jgi:KDO2-lipid IV(A) lauroyltransferase
MINKGLSRLGTFFLYLISLLPFWFLYLISDFLFFIVYRVIGYRRKVVQENLLKAFPEKTGEERRYIEKKYYKYLADLIVETVKMVTASEKSILKRITATNGELIDKYFDEGRSIMLAVGHYGNWEMSALMVSTLVKKRLLIVYKPLTNNIFDNFFNKMRSRFGAEMIAMKNVLRTMVKEKNNIIMSVFVADQTPVQHEATYFTTFLNQPTAFFLGIEKIAKLTDPVVVFGDLKYVKRGHYEYTGIVLTENAKETAEYEITDKYVRCLETMIKRQPQYWLWSHRRWKFKPEDNR